MSEPKVRCTRCDAEFLLATAQRTGGICMACKLGGAPEFSRGRLWIQRGADPNLRVPWYQSPWRQEIIDACRQILCGDLQCLEGAQKMAGFSEIVLDSAHGDRWLHPDWTVFYPGPLDFSDPTAVATWEDQVRIAARRFLQEVECPITAPKPAQ